MSAGRRYRVLGVLGRGGFGTVYKAEQLGEGAFVRPVALKVLNPGVEGVRSVAARLRDEARLLAMIRHRAIVQVDGLVWLDDRWTVVMEYVHGVDLSRVVADRRVPARPALEIVGEVAGALHVANTWPSTDGGTLGLLHRDLKPANLILTSAGEVKVLDFGVARAQWTDREAETRGMRFGTPDYMAPERLEADERPAGDVYSLGVVLFELLAGHPAGRASIRESKHQALVAAALAEVAGLEVELRGLLAGMLAWRPEDRPTSREVETRCRELVTQLDGPFLRDWAEGVVPPLLALGSLGDAGTDFSADVVTEQSPSRPLGATPEPAAAEGTFAFPPGELTEATPPPAPIVEPPPELPERVAKKRSDPMLDLIPVVFLVVGGSMVATFVLVGLFMFLGLFVEVLGLGYGY